MGFFSGFFLCWPVLEDCIISGKQTAGHVFTFVCASVYNVAHIASSIMSEILPGLIRSGGEHSENSVESSSVVQSAQSLFRVTATGT